jgi:superfamily II DNA helicase RecQ
MRTEFQTKFDNILEALTATATVKTREVILSGHNMAKCHLSIEPPDKHNIKATP